MNYYKFNYHQHSDDKVINEGDAFYCTEGEPDFEEMKRMARIIVKNDTANISIHDLVEIEEEAYETLTGKPLEF